MQALARWLVARPLNSVLALAATASLAWLSFFSGVVLVLVMLHRGPRAAVLGAAGAAALLAALSLLLQARVDVMLGSALTVWVPAALLALLLQWTRSLALTLQVAWLGTVAVLVLFFAVVRDPLAFWQGQIELFATALKEQGLSEQAAILQQDIGGVATQLTMVTALLIFSISVVGLVLGYKLDRQLEGSEARYGRFRDLNFGRVIALVTAVASVAAWLGGWLPLQNIAFVMFAMFWLQGLAIAHWSHGQGYMPTFGLAAVYVLAPILNVILLMGLAIAGYIDAWFGFRRLKTAK